MKSAKYFSIIFLSIVFSNTLNESHNNQDVVQINILEQNTNYVIINYRNKFFNDYMLMVLSLIAIMMIIGDMFMANSYKRSLWVPAIMFIIYSKQKLKIHFKNK